MRERLRGKVDKKTNNLFMHKLVNSMDEARTEINDKMGRYTNPKPTTTEKEPPTASLPAETSILRIQDQDIEAEDHQSKASKNSG